MSDKQEKISLEELSRDLISFSQPELLLDDLSARLMNSQLLKGPRTTRKFPKTRAATRLAAANKRTFREILKRDDKCINEAHGIVSMFARKMAWDLSLSEGTWDACLDKYIAAELTDPKAKNTRRGNIYRQMALTNMSHHVLMRFMAVIGIEEFELEGRYKFKGESHLPWRTTVIGIPDVGEYVKTMEQLEFDFDSGENK